MILLTFTDVNINVNKRQHFTIHSQLDTIPDTIKEAVSEGEEPVRAKDLILTVKEKHGTSESVVRTELSRMLKDGRLSQPRRGYYLPGQGYDKSVSQAEGILRAPNVERRSDLIMIPLASVSASAGSGSSVFTDEVSEYVGYSRSQLKRETGSDPSRMVIIVVSGSSMLPTLMPGDRLLVSKYQGEPLYDGAIYVLRNRYGGVMVKRIHWASGNTLIISGDNDSSPEIEVDPSEEDSDWSVVGRVVRVEKPL